MASITKLPTHTTMSKLMVIATDDLAIALGKCGTVLLLKKFQAQGWRFALITKEADNYACAHANDFLPADDIFTEVLCFGTTTRKDEDPLGRLRDHLAMQWPMWTRFIAMDLHWLEQLEPQEIETHLRLSLVGNYTPENDPHGYARRVGNGLWRRSTLPELLTDMLDEDNKVSVLA